MKREIRSLKQSFPKINDSTEAKIEIVSGFL